MNQARLENRKTMKNRSVLTVMSMVLAVAASLQAAPRLTMDNSSFDFGYVPQNSAISHEFWLKSAGTDTLRILKVVPG
jgi:hypothetical protein